MALLSSRAVRNLGPSSLAGTFPDGSEICQMNPEEGKGATVFFSANGSKRLFPLFLSFPKSSCKVFVLESCFLVGQPNAAALPQFLMTGIMGASEN